MFDQAIESGFFYHVSIHASSDPSPKWKHSMLVFAICKYESTPLNNAIMTPSQRDLNLVVCVTHSGFSTVCSCVCVFMSVCV